MLADRSSHYYCTDNENTKVFPCENNDYCVTMDNYECDGVKHGMIILYLFNYIRFRTFLGIDC